MEQQRRISLQMADESVVANCLRDLKSEAKEKFKLTTNDICVRLEDGTIVGDEDYFSILDPSTHFIITVVGDEGKGGGDAVDSAIACGSSTSPENTKDINYLMKRLRCNIANLVTFTEEQLEVIVDADIKHLQNGLHLTREEAENLQEGCYSRVYEKQRAADAVEVLRIFNEHMSQMDQTDSPKREASSPPRNVAKREHQEVHSSPPRKIAKREHQESQPAMSTRREPQKSQHRMFLRSESHQGRQGKSLRSGGNTEMALKA